VPKGKNVTTIVGLRAYSAMSNILPEQTLGRGLRKMYPGNDVKKYVSVVGTDAFMDFVESIQSEVVELERAAMGAGTKPKSVFNRIVGGQSHLELEFAAFLEACDDIISYVKNYLAVHFKIEYVNANGDISNYYPDFIVKISVKEVFIIETKGLEDLDVPLKMQRLKQWCDDINKAQRKLSMTMYS
jgi:restriction endonuclease